LPVRRAGGRRIGPDALDRRGQRDIDPPERFVVEQLFLGLAGIS